MEYWQKGRLPKDDLGLAKLAGLCDERWLSVRSTLAQRFDENWRHKRIDRELELAEEKSAKAYRAALKSIESRRNKRPLSKRSTNANRPSNGRSYIKDLSKDLSTSSAISGSDGPIHIGEPLQRQLASLGHSRGK